jgi:hypothetical protein
VVIKKKAPAGIILAGRGFEAASFPDGELAANTKSLYVIGAMRLLLRPPE